MTPDDKYSRLIPEPLHLLPVWEIDMSGGQPIDPNMPRLVPEPLHLLPEMRYDMVAAAPALVLTLQVRPEAKAAAVAVDLLQMYTALNRYEISLGGSGLTMDESRSGPTPDGTAVRLVLTATDPAGAIARLSQLRDAIHGTANPVSVAVGQSFSACKAELVVAA